MASPELGGGDGSYDFHLRSLSAASRDSAAATDPASDPNLFQSVRRVCEMCREAKEARDEMVACVFPMMSKLFQRCAAAPTKAVASTGMLLLTILQFFLDFGEAVLLDADGSLKTFFHSCLSREFADPIVAERSLFLQSCTCMVCSNLKPPQSSACGTGVRLQEFQLVGPSYEKMNMIKVGAAVLAQRFSGFMEISGVSVVDQHGTTSLAEATSDAPTGSRIGRSSRWHLKQL